MTQDFLPPSWRRPPGVSKGTWQYVHQRSIARHYQAFVADTPLCKLDEAYVRDHLQSELAGIARQNSGPSIGLVADFGCGNGRVARPIAGDRWDVLAIDLSQPMLEELVNDVADDSHSASGGTERMGTVTTGAVMAVRANLVELEAIRGAIADHAVCLFSTLGMVQSRAARTQFLRHAWRIVRPGGSLILHVHRRWAALRERGGWRKLLGNGMRSLYRSDVEFGDAVYSYRGLDKMFMHRFSAREIRRELGAAGWQIERLDRVDLRGERITAVPWNASGFFIVCRKPPNATVPIDDCEPD